jgi:colanic acid/amylovoran biosynthesis protein
MFALKMDYRVLLPELLMALLQAQPHNILLIPHTYSTLSTVENDLEISIKVRDALPVESRNRIHVVTGNYNQYELKGIIGMCSFFIGSRMHACIAALSQSIPCVGIAYSRKFAGVFDSVGMIDWVISGQTMDNAAAVKQILTLFQNRESAHKVLQIQVEQAREKIREVFAKLLSSTLEEKAIR